jgi:hypothetical protein
MATSQGGREGRVCGDIRGDAMELRAGKGMMRTGTDVTIQP